MVLLPHRLIQLVMVKVVQKALAMLKMQLLTSLALIQVRVRVRVSVLNIFIPIQ